MKNFFRERNSNRIFKGLITLTMLLSASYSYSVQSMTSNLKNLSLIDTKEADSTFASTEDRVIIESQVGVYFAPEDRRGIYSFQIIQNGQVTSVDNKKNTKVLAVLSTKIIQNLLTSIKNISTTNTLITEPGQRCMDAPTYTMFAYSATGVKSSIYKREACLDSLSTDLTANELAKWFQSLERTLKDRSFEITSGSSDGISLASLSVNKRGQEGYSAPRRPVPVTKKGQKIAFCQANPTGFYAGIPFFVEVFEVKDSSKEFVLEIHPKGLPQSLQVLVADGSTWAPGSPRVFAGSGYSLSIQGTVTPRPDHKLPGVITKVKSNGSLDYSIDLLCEYTSK